MTTEVVRGPDVWHTGTYSAGRKLSLQNTVGTKRGGLTDCPPLVLCGTLVTRSQCGGRVGSKEGMADTRFRLKISNCYHNIFGVARIND